jgi:hypothetical protein
MFNSTTKGINMTHPADRIASDYTTRQRLHHDARAMANSLRREAMEHFWREAGQEMADAGAFISRSARLLRDRLARHAALRTANSAGTPCNGA